jgi:hypothetical protein
LKQGNILCEVSKVTLDTGASNGNYIGYKILMRSGMDDRKCKPCNHVARLGDGSTELSITKKIRLDISLYDDQSILQSASGLYFYVVEKLGDEVIIGLNALLGPLFKFFLNILVHANDPDTQLLTKDTNEATLKALEAPVWSSVFKDNPMEAIVEPWSKPKEECAEEVETPDPLSFPEDILHFMEVSVEQSRLEYIELFETHISKEMIEACPEVVSLLKSEIALEVFAPSEWNGLKIEPAVIEVRKEMPLKCNAKARPVRPDLYEPAKKEFDRLRKYFYTDSDSAIASPLVIAPKATSPFIRFCGDYRWVNNYIVIPPRPIPRPQYELMKAAKFNVFIDLDMANSFHQIPLSLQLSNLLSVVTPWGLVRPLFLPEGVGPASGLLQQIVQVIFEDFNEWIIVIFDNFLVLANDYRDAYSKFKAVLKRCQEYHIVLKFKKSWIGVDTVTFFGYQVTAGSWQLSDERKESVQAITFPDNKKSMQSFLGAALFFHHHIPDYSEWSAKLYEMTHENFQWKPALWSYDYESHFNRFKTAIVNAQTLYFPDYSKEWVLRCDASDYAVGAVLFQKEFLTDGTIQNQPLAFSSKRFSAPAKNWDTYKKEAYAIFHAVFSFAYYLRGKEFLVETDHRNLQWIELSQAPIVVRWRNLLQNFTFRILHIPGTENRVADFISRMPSSEVTLTPQLGVLDASPDPTPLLPPPHPPPFETIMNTVHGGRSFHYGSYETWRRAIDQFPSANVPIEAVRIFVKECPMCQKSRDTGIKGIKPRTLHLKPDAYRRTIGVDHFTVTPKDHNGNVCAVMLVEHFSHFPQAYAASTYDAETLARILFKHFCTFGMFHQLASDPGSAMMSEVVAHLNKWLGISHKVSLVGRHESNGCEGSIKQFLRHLRTLVYDERMVSNWSDDTVLPLINFALCSYPTTETGGYTPFQLKYGTADAGYFRLPESPPPDKSAALLQTLDRNLRSVRASSLSLQQQLIVERQARDGSPQAYSPGDLFLFNRRENPLDMLPDKLSPPFLGPYRVLHQAKNDVTCEHVVTHDSKILHVSRVKPFFGTWDSAFTVGQLDKDQYLIISINYFTGNPHVRKSLLFNVTFEGPTTVMIPYSPDLATAETFIAYVESLPWLYPLLHPPSTVKKNMASLNKCSIDSFCPGQEAHLHMRYFDSFTLSWYDTLDLPLKEMEYFVIINFESWVNTKHTKINARCELFNRTLVLTHYDVFAYVIRSDIEKKFGMVLVTESNLESHRGLLPWAHS